MTDALPRTATGPDDRLKNYVLAQTGGNERLSEPTCLVVLPALGGREDLADVLGDDAISQKGSWTRSPPSTTLLSRSALI